MRGVGVCVVTDLFLFQFVSVGFESFYDLYKFHDITIGDVLTSFRHFSAATVRLHSNRIVAIIKERRITSFTRLSDVHRGVTNGHLM